MNAPMFRGAVVVASILLAFPALPQTGPELGAQVDRIAKDVLASTGTPSASVAVVVDGRIAYVQAYGNARLQPPTPARPEMRYSIGSISKQFTATVLLMLAEERKLSFDDPVARFLPGLARAQDVKVRQLLSHTSGYQDYWPQDYVPPFMQQPTTAQGILDRWATRSLDFEPGSQYQYSNTGYVIAGLIAEKASGVPLWELLAKRVFAPLGMDSVTSVDRGRLAESDATGYMRYGLGPQRVAPKEGPGWLFAAGELAMTARDLARWNIGVLERRLLKPASYDEMQAEVRLTNGVGAGYGLGLDVEIESGHRVLEHGGAVSGFTATNRILPDDRAAVSVLTNGEMSAAGSAIARKITRLLFEKRDAAAASEARARLILAGLQRGSIDRSLLTENANSYFTEEALRDFAEGLAPLEAPTKLEQTQKRERGGFTLRAFDVTFPKKTLQIVERDSPDGKIEQFQVFVKD